MDFRIMVLFFTKMQVMVMVFSYFAMLSKLDQNMLIVNRMKFNMIR